MTDLLLLPGLNCDAAVWADVVPRLPADLRCQVPAFATQRSLAAMADVVLAAAPVRFALAGHSMGARVALEVVRRAPERVTRLALLDTGCRARPDGAAGEDERRRRHELLAIARDQGMRAMAAVWVQGMVHVDRLRDAPLIEAIVAMIARHTPAMFAAQIEALLARPDARALLRTVRVPTLVACGGDDGWAPIAQHQEIAALTPGARLVAFERCGHMAPMERPRDVAAALNDWLNEDAQTRAA